MSFSDRPPREIVLPCGAFAQVRRITWGDWVATPDATIEIRVTKLLARCVTLDGKPITFEQLLALDFADVAPLQKLMMEDLEAGSKLLKGVA